MNETTQKVQKTTKKHIISITPSSHLKYDRGREQVDRPYSTLKTLGLIAASGFTSAIAIRAIDQFGQKLSDLDGLPGMRTLSNWPIIITILTPIACLLFLIGKTLYYAHRDRTYQNIIDTIDEK